MTEPFDAVLVEAEKLALGCVMEVNLGVEHYTEILDRLAAAHAAEVAGLDARIERYMLLCGQCVKLLEAEKVRLPDGFTVEAASLRFAEELAERRVRAEAAERDARRKEDSLRVAVLALAHASEADPVYRDAYENVSAALKGHAAIATTEQADED